MNEWLAVAAGGAAGSLLRFGIGKAMAPQAASFPWATLLANVLACLVLGAAWAWFGRRQDLPEATRLLITTGFCGGFSTFSTFSLETARMIAGGQWGAAALYVGLSLLACLAAVALSLRI
ncbi:MAG: fluoride efflux transporter CrcB [Bacteroidia bacterium]|nr:fluoride efflux transporter CrcB [Bacteroidia bacterium]